MNKPFKDFTYNIDNNHSSSLIAATVFSNLGLRRSAKDFDINLTREKDKTESKYNCYFQDFINSEIQVSEGELATLAKLNTPLIGFGKPIKLPWTITSFLAGLYGAAATSATLAFKNKASFSVNLFESALILQTLRRLLSLEDAKNWKPLIWLATPFVGTHRAKDNKFIYIHIGLTKHLHKFIEHLKNSGEEKVATALLNALSTKAQNDPFNLSMSERFSTLKILRKLFKTKNAITWSKELTNAGLCVVEVLEPNGYKEDKQFNEQSNSPEFKFLPPHNKPLEFPTPKDGEPLLNNLRVLDMSQVIAGPFAGRVMGEWGANVVHLENPNFSQGFTDMFHAGFHSNKNAIFFDLKDSKEKLDFEKWVEDFKPHVLLHNFRPGKLEAMKLNFLSNIPVTCHVTAYGPDGHLANAPGWEQTVQALSGMQTAFGGTKSPDIFPFAINDMGTGLLALSALFAGIHSYKKDGKAVITRVSLSQLAKLMQESAKNNTTENSTINNKTDHSLKIDDLVHINPLRFESHPNRSYKKSYTRKSQNEIRPQTKLSKYLANIGAIIFILYRRYL